MVAREAAKSAKKMTGAPGDSISSQLRTEADITVDGEVAAVVDEIGSDGIDDRASRGVLQDQVFARERVGDDFFGQPQGFDGGRLAIRETGCERDEDLEAAGQHAVAFEGITKSLEKPSVISSSEKGFLFAVGWLLNHVVKLA